MHLVKSILEGLEILGFDKDTIKKVSRENTLEEIFLTTLFFNYLIVLVVYLIGLMLGGYTIEGRAVNMPVLFGFLMIYPFVFNVLIYFLYGFFGLMAEMLNSHDKVKPLLSVGFHTAIVYSALFYILAFIATFNLGLSLLLLGVFGFYFLYSLFVNISTVYSFSMHQTLIVIFIPFLLLAGAFLVLQFFIPHLLNNLLVLLFA